MAPPRGGMQMRKRPMMNRGNMSNGVRKPMNNGMRPMASNMAAFRTNQMMDNPGYMDFNEPAPSLGGNNGMQKRNNMQMGNPFNGNNDNGMHHNMSPMMGRKPNNNNNNMGMNQGNFRQNNQGHHQQQQNNQGHQNMNNNRRSMNNGGPMNNGGGQQNGRGMQMNHQQQQHNNNSNGIGGGWNSNGGGNNHNGNNHSNNNRNNGGGPGPMNGNRGGGNMRPMRGNGRPMMGGPMGPPMRGGFRPMGPPMRGMGRPPMGPCPPPPPPQMRGPPRQMMMSRRGMGRPMNPGMMMNKPMKGGNSANNQNGNLKRKQPAQGKKGGNKRKANHQPQDPYPMDKEWVTDAIREQLKKKEDVAERLKGNKDDELFAQFKAERDVFVKMYDEAKKEYLEKNPPKPVPAPAEAAKTDAPAAEETKAAVDGDAEMTDVAPTETPAVAADKVVDNEQPIVVEQAAVEQ